MPGSNRKNLLGQLRLIGQNGGRPGIEPSVIGKTLTAQVSLKVNGARSIWQPDLPGMADNTAEILMSYSRDFQTFMPYHDKGVVGFDVNTSH